MTVATNRPAFAFYRSRISGQETLSTEAEKALAGLYRSGDKDAGRRLIEACLPFVVSIAIEYRRWGLPLEDIVQEGNIGLLKAVARFDPDRACRLATYAAYWIRAEIREYVARGYRIVRLGSSKSERRALRIYRRTRERDPAILAESSGLTKERAEDLLPVLMARDVSLDAPPTDEGMSPSDRLASIDPSPEDRAASAEDEKKLHDALVLAVAELSPREQRIVKCRWLTEDPRTLEEIGTEFGISKERVRQLEERAKRRMRARIEELVGEGYRMTG